MVPKTKLCPGCNQQFEGRPNAQACSTRCRKRIFRAKQALQREVQKLAELRQAAIADIRSSLATPQLATVAAEVPSDFDGDTLLELPGSDSFGRLFADTESVPSTAYPAGHVISPHPPTPAVSQPLAPQPAVATLETPLSPSVQPLNAAPEIQSLETKPTAEHWQQLQNSWQTPPTQSPNPPTGIGAAMVPEPGGANTYTPMPLDPSSSSGGSRLVNFVKQRPIFIGLCFTVLVVLISGVFALSGLLRQTKPGDTSNLSSQADDSTTLAAKDAKLSLNLDTVVAKGKTLTLGQLVADSTSGILQLTGDLNASGSLLASGGTSSLNNSGLTINKILVCTSAGCTPNATIGGATGNQGLTALPATTTLQGNTFNGISQLLQLSATGALPILNGAALTSVDAASLQGNNAAYYTNGSNVSSGTLADVRLSTNVTLQGNTFNGASQLVQLTAAGILPVLSGANLTSLNGSNISSGIVTDARLSANVALLNGAGPQTFSGNNKFTGTFLAQNAANSTTAFQIQNAAGTSNLLVADTTNSRIAVAQATAAYALDVNGDINSATGIRVGGALLCSASGCTATSGSANYIQNSLNLQTANFNIQSVAAASVTGIIRASATQTADLLQLKDSSGTNIVTIGPTGDTLIQPSTNSTSAFQVFNANGTSHLIGGDTLNSRVAIAKPTPPDYTLDVGGDINTTTGLRVAGNLVCSTTCTPGGGSGNYIQNGIALQTANFAIQSDLNTHIVGLIRGASGQSADLLQLISGDGGTIQASFGATGAITFKNSIDSTAAFQIQNAAGTSNLLVADTTNSEVGIGKTPSAGGATLQVQGAINATSDLYAGGGTYYLGGGGTFNSKNINDDGTSTVSIGSVGSSTSISTTNIATTTDATGTQTVNIGSQAKTANSLNLNAGTLGGINIGRVGTSAIGSSIHIADTTDATGNQVITIGSSAANANNATTIQGGSGAGAVSIQSAASGTISIGTSGVANTLQLGNTTGAVTQTINIGNNATASSTTNVVIGSTIAGTTTLQSAGGVAVSTLGTANTDTVVCRNGSSILATCNSTFATSANAFFQNGNSFAATAVLGTNDSNSLTFETNNTTQATIAVGGATTFQNSTNSTTAFQVQNAASTQLFVIDTTNSRVYVGNPTADSTGAILVLDTKNTSGDPTGVDGAMYYNSNTTSFRCYTNGSWSDCAFTQLDHSYYFADDFIGGETTTPSDGNIKGDGWRVKHVGTPSGHDLKGHSEIYPSTDHPGTWAMLSGTASNTGYTLIQGVGSTADNPYGSFNAAVGQDIKTTVAMRQTTNFVFKVGLSNQPASTSAPTAGVWWEAVPGTNANWRYCYGDGSAAQCTNTSVAIATDTWVRLEITITALGTNTSAATFTIDGTSASVSGVTIAVKDPGTGTKGLAPGFALWTTNTTSQKAVLDYYQISGVTSALR